MIRMEFNTYDDGTFYFLYVTDEVRIETDGVSGLQIEDSTYKVRNNPEIFGYLTIEEAKDAYFNESLINPNIDTVIKAVRLLRVLLEEHR